MYSSHYVFTCGKTSVILRFVWIVNWIGKGHRDWAFLIVEEWLQQNRLGKIIIDGVGKILPIGTTKDKNIRIQLMSVNWQQNWMKHVLITSFWTQILGLQVAKFIFEGEWDRNVEQNAFSLSLWFSDTFDFPHFPFFSSLCLPFSYIFFLFDGSFPEPAAQTVLSWASQFALTPSPTIPSFSLSPSAQAFFFFWLFQQFFNLYLQLTAYFFEFLVFSINTLAWAVISSFLMSQKSLLMMKHIFSILPPSLLGIHSFNFSPCSGGGCEGCSNGWFGRGYHCVFSVLLDVQLGVRRSGVHIAVRLLILLML